RTLCLSSNARISATSPGSREATPRFTLLNSAPIVQVSGSTLLEPRVAVCAGASMVAFVMSFSCQSMRLVADDSGALQIAHRRPEILHRIVLRAAVVPDREAVLAKAEANLVFGDVRLAQQVVEQQARPGIRVLAEAHVLRGVEVGQVRRERVDEKHFLAGVPTRSDD